MKNQHFSDHKVSVATGQICNLDQIAPSVSTVVARVRLSYVGKVFTCQLS